MFEIKLNDSSIVEVASKQHRFSYSADGSHANPLEATYAALTACAGVYARKACSQMGISAEGIHILCRLMGRSDNPLVPAKVVTRISFPPRFTPDQRRKVASSVEQCPVKALISNGHQLEFVTEEADA